MGFVASPSPPHPPHNPTKPNQTKPNPTQQAKPAQNDAIFFSTFRPRNYPHYDALFLSFSRPRNYCLRLSARETRFPAPPPPPGRRNQRFALARVAKRRAAFQDRLRSLISAPHPRRGRRGGGGLRTVREEGRGGREGRLVAMCALACVMKDTEPEKL